jgi:hypothetical protein
MSETRTDSPFDPELIRDRLISEAASRFARSEPTIATELLRQLSGFPIDDTILQSTDPFFRPWIVGEKTVIASFEPGRRPTEGEIIVIYGNYPHMYENIVVNNPIKRHASTFWNLVHDRIEYDRRWDPIDQIYIINADKRIDRYDSILRELAAAKRPSTGSRECPRPYRRIGAYQERWQGASAACRVIWTLCTGPGSRVFLTYSCWKTTSALRAIWKLIYKTCRPFSKEATLIGSAYLPRANTGISCQKTT